MIKVGIVGYGFAGRGLHSYLVQQTPGLKLAAVVSLSSEKRQQAAQEYGVKTYPDLTQLLQDSEIDLVIIATPHHLHAEQAIQTMSAGKHCVVDKIMCMNPQEAIAMWQVAQKNQVLLSVFQNRRWDWDFLTLQKALQSGLIGEPFRIESKVSRYKLPRRWRADKDKMGGILFDWGPHLIDQALQLTGKLPTQVYCDISYRHWPTDIGSHCQLILKFPQDLVFEMEISYLCMTSRPRWTVLGTHGAIVKYGLDPQEAAILAGNLAAAKEDPEQCMQIQYEKDGLNHQEIMDAVKGSWQNFYTNIVEVLNDKAELIVKPEQIIQQMQILEAATSSAETGQVVSLIFKQ